MERGITQTELAEAMGVHKQYLSRVEKGRVNVTLNTIVKLSKGLDVDTSEIIEPE